MPDTLKVPFGPDTPIPSVPTVRQWLLIFERFTLYILLIVSLYYNYAQNEKYIEHLKADNAEDKSVYLRIFDQYDRAASDRDYYRSVYNQRIDKEQARGKDTVLLRGR